MVNGEGGGQIFIRGGKLFINNSVISLTNDNVDAGYLDVNLTDSLVIDAGAIHSLTHGNGNGENIFIDVESIEMTESSLVASESIGSGKAGNVKVVANDLISISGGEDEEVTTAILSATSGNGNAGDVILKAKNLLANGVVLLSNSTLSQEDKAGNSGKIEIEVDSLTLNNGVLIDSSTWGNGQAGNIMITASDSISISSTHPTLISALRSSGYNGKAGSVIIKTKNFGSCG